MPGETKGRTPRHERTIPTNSPQPRCSLPSPPENSDGRTPRRGAEQALAREQRPRLIQEAGRPEAHQVAHGRVDRAERVRGRPAGAPQRPQGERPLAPVAVLWSGRSKTTKPGDTTISPTLAAATSISRSMNQTDDETMTNTSAE